MIELKPDKLFLLIGTFDMANGKTNTVIVEGIQKIIYTTVIHNHKTKIFLESIYPICEKDNPIINKNYIIYRNNKRIKEINSELQNY